MKVKFSSEKAAREFMENLIKDTVKYDNIGRHQCCFATDMQLHLYFEEFTISYWLNWGEDVVSACIRPRITENRTITDIENISLLKTYLGMFDVLATKGEVLKIVWGK